MPPKKDQSKAQNQDGEDVGVVDVFLVNMKKYGFSQKTVEILRANEFSDMESLGLLEGQNEEISKLGLSLQQRLLLSKLVDSGKSEASEASVGASALAAGSSVALNSVMSELMSTNTPLNIQGGQQSEPGCITDPQVFLKGGCTVSAKAKFLDIVDYVNMVPPVSEEQVFCEEDGVQVLFRSGVKRPAIETLTIEEWCLANTRIMYELLENGNLGVISLKDYMAYTVKVCDLFRHFERVSVLQYDREYRHFQTVYSFRWGTDVPHLHTTCLRAKQTQPKISSVNRGKQRVGERVRSKEVCRLYNTENGCHYQTSCKYVHRCNEPGCQQFHSRAHAHRDTHTRTVEVVDPNA